MLLLITADTRLHGAVFASGVDLKTFHQTEEALYFLDLQPARDRATWLIGYGLDVVRDPHQRAVPGAMHAVALHRHVPPGLNLTVAEIAGMLRLGVTEALGLPLAAVSLHERIVRQETTARFEVDDELVPA